MITIKRNAFNNKLIVEMPQRCDRWSDDVFIFTTTIDACIQCLIEEDVLDKEPKLDVKGYEELFNEYSDWLYDYFNDDIFDAWSKETGKSL